jgi:VWFA-related protein
MRRQTLFALVFLAVPLFAQTPPVIEKIDVSVVNVDVTVTDRAGNPVRGLTRDDFEVYEDGKPQKITNFYAVENQNQKASAPADDRFRRTVLVIVDNVTTTRYNRDRALDRLEEFINNSFTGGQYDWSLAVVDHGAQMLLAPTSDKKQIFEAIGEVRKPFAREVTRLALDAGISSPPGTSCSTQRLSGMLAASDRLQLAANESHSAATVVQAIRGFSGVPGKKIILLLTADVTVQFDPLSVTACMPAGTEQEVSKMYRERITARQYMVREANASNVSLYIINTEGLRAGGWEESDNQIGARVASSEHWVRPTDNASLFWLARETGGRLLPGNYVDQSLVTFDAASSNFYSLGYRPSHGDDSRYHRIRVRLKREGKFDLQYRDGYTNFPSNMQLIRLLQSPIAPAMQTSAIPVSLSVGAPNNSKGVFTVPIVASVPLTSLTVMPTTHSAPVEVFISLFDDRGRNIQFIRFDRAANAGDARFVERQALRLKKGVPYRVVVAVRDPLTEAFGIAHQVVKF